MWKSSRWVELGCQNEFDTPDLCHFLMPRFIQVTSFPFGHKMSAFFLYKHMNHTPLALLPCLVSPSNCSSSSYTNTILGFLFLTEQSDLPNDTAAAAGHCSVEILIESVFWDLMMLTILNDVQLGLTLIFHFGNRVATQIFYLKNKQTYKKTGNKCSFVHSETYIFLIIIPFSYHVSYTGSQGAGSLEPIPGYSRHMMWRWCTP